LEEETVVTPKPLVTIGGKPIIWHIMKLYFHYGYREFVICLGYKGYLIKEYFANYLLHNSDVTIDLSRGDEGITLHEGKAEPWKVTLVDTGLHTQTGGRIRRIRKYVEDEPFMLTYGDGVGDIDIAALVDFHLGHGKIATVTGVQAPFRFGTLDVDDTSHVRRFAEKPSEGGSWINGGFFVLDPGVFDYLPSDDDTSWERTPLESLARDCQLMVHKHRGFWKCMDTVRDRRELESQWDSGHPPWVIWDDGSAHLPQAPS